MSSKLPPTTTTRLGHITGSASTTPPTRAANSHLAAVLSISRGEVVDLPVLGRARINLIGARRWQTFEAEVASELRRLEVDPTTARGILAREAELAMRVLSEAVRDPDDPSLPFGSLEEWGRLDNDVVSAAWLAFGDVRDRLEPAPTPLGDDEAAAIAHAVGARNDEVLRTFGATKLAQWMTSTTVTPRAEDDANAATPSTAED
jgi:hypothetical protein